MTSALAIVKYLGRNLSFRAWLWRLLIKAGPGQVEVKGLGKIKHLAKNTDNDLVIIVDGEGKL